MSITIGDYAESVGRVLARAELLLESIRSSHLAPCPACHRFSIGANNPPMHEPGCHAVALRQALDNHATLCKGGVSNV